MEAPFFFFQEETKTKITENFVCVFLPSKKKNYNIEKVVGFCSNTNQNHSLQQLLPACVCVCLPKYLLLPLMMDTESAAAAGTCGISYHDSRYSYWLLVRTYDRKRMSCF